MITYYDYLDRHLKKAPRSTRRTPKDIYAVLVSGKRQARCISCCIGLGVEFARSRKGDIVVNKACQGAACQAEAKVKRSKKTDERNRT